MEKTQTYENYPWLFVAASNLVTFSIYILGAAILWDLGKVVVILFLLYCLGLEIRLLKKSCVDCYYYGKRCFSGKGLLCSLFFKQGDPKRFTCHTITWVQLIPDFLLSLVPLVAGVVLSFTNFSWLRLILMLLLVVMAFPLTGFIRGNLACRHCKQRELGCPANELFGGKK